MIKNYRSGVCRNSEPGAVKSHTYAEDNEGNLYPMCGYGWNRSDGTAFSIFRGSPGTEGTCERCRRNLAAGRGPVVDGWPHKTKWI